jgi:holo-[acyl-carrier protein] synthase
METVEGIGNDLIEIVRIRKSIERHGQHFLDRIFTRREQDYCYRFQDPIPHFAGRFAAKEAVAKAFGTGIGADIFWHEIEIVNDEQGKPIVFLSEDVLKRFNHPQVLLSISHGTEIAMAVAIVKMGGNN